MLSWAKLIDREERLIFLELGEDDLDVVHFLPVFGVSRLVVGFEYEGDARRASGRC